MPGPLSILLEKTEAIPDIVTAGSKLVAIRIPNHPLTLQLLEQLDFPLAAPSANPFGYISPTSVKHVQDQLGGKISYILDGGNCSVGIESTIIKMERHFPEGEKENVITVLRVGGVPVEAIERVVGKVKVANHSSSNPAAPGMLKSHYAPRNPLVIDDVEKVLQHYASERIGILAFAKYHPAIPPQNQLILSANSDLKEAAQNLFAHLRTLDKMDVDIIVTALVPEKGLGRAINDKLRRASV